MNDTEKERKRTIPKGCTMLGRHHSEESKIKMRNSALSRSISGGRTHGFSSDYPKLYNIWNTMKGRCENPNRENFKNYGGRGIVLCPEWHLAENFCRWALENGYKEGLQLDRKENNKGYSPENCRWVTPKTNSRNRRNTVYLCIDGEKRCVSEWCETVDISQYTIYWWVKKYGIKYAEKRIKERLSMQNKEIKPFKESEEPI